MIEGGMPLCGPSIPCCSWTNFNLDSENIQYVTDIICGTILIVAALFHPCLFAYIVAGFGAAIILWAVVGLNIAAYVGSRQPITLTDEPTQTR